MGRRTYSDIVENVAYVGDLSLFDDANNFYKIKSPNGNVWHMIFEAANGGKNKRLYVNVYGKVVAEKGYFVCELREETTFAFDSHIFSATKEQLEEIKEHISSKDFDENNEEADGELTPFKSIKEFIGDKSAVETFIDDFVNEGEKISVVIEKEDALSQTI